MTAIIIPASFHCPPHADIRVQRVGIAQHATHRRWCQVGIARVCLWKLNTTFRSSKLPAIVSVSLCKLIHLSRCVTTLRGEGTRYYYSCHQLCPTSVVKKCASKRLLSSRTRWSPLGSTVWRVVAEARGPCAARLRKELHDAIVDSGLYIFSPLLLSKDRVVAYGIVSNLLKVY